MAELKVSPVKRGYGHIPGKENPNHQTVIFTNDHMREFNQHVALMSAKPKPAHVPQPVIPSQYNLLDVVHIPESQAPYDQGSLGSCTANATSFAFVFDELKQNNTAPFMPSRLFLYYNSRSIEGTVSQDYGAMLSDVIAAVGNPGMCEEELWPYDVTQYATVPKPQCYTESKTCTSLNSYKVQQNLQQLKLGILSGYPILFGFVVYESFETPQVADTGIVPMPGENDNMVGGHAVCAVAFDNSKQAFLCRNSWGTEWGYAINGIRGYFWLPYDYITNPDLASDFWIISKISDPAKTNIIDFNSNDLQPDVVNLSGAPENDGTKVVHD